MLYEVLAILPIPVNNVRSLSSCLVSMGLFTKGWREVSICLFNRGELPSTCTN